MSKKVTQILTPPGAGLLRVSTGDDDYQRLSQMVESRIDLKNWGKSAKKALKHCSETHSPILLGVPSDMGGGILRGAAHGPLHLRRGLFEKSPEWMIRDIGDIPCIPQLLDDGMLNRKQKEACGRALWGKDYASASPVSPLNILETLLKEEWGKSPNLKVMVLGGDHSISAGVFAALRHHPRFSKLGVLHIDAHTDLLEERYGIATCFGTWVAQALIGFDTPKRWVQLGIRTSSKSKAHWQKKFGLTQFWSRDLIDRCPEEFAEKLVEHYERIGCEHLYVTHDIDGTDARFVPSTGTPEKLGLVPGWLIRMLRKLTSSMPLMGSDMVEVAPKIGSKKEIEKTLKVAVRYIEALNW